MLSEPKSTQQGLTQGKAALFKLKKLDNKRCPKCGRPGSGPHSRYVLNSRKRRYGPYLYYAHHFDGKLKWCYLGRPKPQDELSNSEMNCRTPPPTQTHVGFLNVSDNAEAPSGSDPNQLSNSSKKAESASQHGGSKAG